jgi:hypothetical protein
MLYTPHSIKDPATLGEALDIISELKGRIHDLEDLLGAQWISPMVLGLTRTEDRVLGVLVNSKRCMGQAAIYELIYSDKLDPPEPSILNVLIHKVRRKLEPHDIVIENRWGFGYQLRDGDREKIDLLYADGERDIDERAA